MVCQHQAGAPAHAGAFLRPSNPISEPIGLANLTSLNHTPVAFTLAEPDPPSTRCDAPQHRSHGVEIWHHRPALRITYTLFPPQRGQSQCVKFTSECNILHTFP